MKDVIISQEEISFVDSTGIVFFFGYDDRIPLRDTPVLKIYTYTRSRLTA